MKRGLCKRRGKRYHVAVMARDSIDGDWYTVGWISGAGRKTKKREVAVHTNRYGLGGTAYWMP
jgi:hypothetical protein